MDKPDENISDRLRKLELENLRLKAELEARKTTADLTGRASRFFVRSTTRVIAGNNLKKSVRRLLDELPGKPSKDTISDVTTHIVWRLTRIGMFALAIAAAPLLIMIIQTYILDLQNEKLDRQNDLLSRQNGRLDQQINLEEGNRRSSLVFFMSNIMDRMDEELKNNRDRKLSDALIGRIVSLTQALRPYRYLEDDQLTERLLSPERGQLLFFLINSNLDEDTYDKIYARSNFSYADLREANFTGGYLKGADLNNSSFHKSIFTNTNLENADLTDAYLEEAIFKKTNMNGVILKNANLRQSYMEGISLRNGDLENADLRNIYLDGDFRGSYLEGVMVQDARLINVKLDSCSFRSLSWIDSLEHYKLRGLAALREYYEPELTIRQKGAERDTFYQLILDPNSSVMQILACNQTVQQIIESAPRVRNVKNQEENLETPLSLYPVANPFGLEDLEIRKDSVYLFRLSSDQGDPSATLMWVQFNPEEQLLWEVFLGDDEPLLLAFDEKLLETYRAQCQLKR